MRFIFDVNVSLRVTRWLNERSDGALHVNQGFADLQTPCKEISVKTRNIIADKLVHLFEIYFGNFAQDLFDNSICLAKIISSYSWNFHTRTTI